MSKNTISLAPRIVLVFILVLALAAALDIFTFDARHKTTAIGANRGLNGLWLRYYWYLAKYPDTDWKPMIKRLNDNQIRYAYFHVLNSDAHGVLKYKLLEKGKRLTTAVHEGAKNTKVIAWIYVPNKPHEDGVDLNDSGTRSTLIEQAKWLVNECGFDGVQWDFEFCPNDHEGHLRLLEESHDVLAPHFFVGACSPMWYPGVLWGWSDSYFKKVAKRCDQIAVMSYDSYFWSPSLYAWLVQQQVVHVSKACHESGTDCTTMVGVPVYEDRTLSHNAAVENLRTALVGVARGLRDPRTDPTRIEGISLFADYTTDAKEWALYRDAWLCSPKP